MSLLSPTYGKGREFDDIVWNELHGDGALIRQVQDDISKICNEFRYSAVADTTMALKYKLQQYADTLYAMKCTRMWYEISGQTISIDVRLPHNLKTVRIRIEFNT